MGDEGNVDMESSPPATTLGESGTKEGSDSANNMSVHSSMDQEVVDAQVNDTMSSSEVTKEKSDETANHLMEMATDPHVGHQRTASGHLIDTAAPIESVREAVSKFGGITDWKVVKAISEQKRRIIESKLERVENELPKYKKQAEDTKEAKEKALNELDSTKRLIEELKLNLERVETEELQAKQDSELAKLRVEEVQQGIDDEASVATNTEFEVAQARHAAAVAELKIVKDELEKVRGEYGSLIVEKDLAVKKAEEAVSASMEVEKTVEALTHELLKVKGSLESAHSTHLDVEEQRIRAEEDTSDLEKELRQAEEELEEFNQKHLSEKEVKLKLDQATTLLLNLKEELEAYKEENSNREQNEDGSESEQLQLRELDEVRLKIEKATAEINCLKVAFTSLESELEREKSEVSAIKMREGNMSVTIASLEADLNRTLSELELICMEKVGNDRAKETNELNQATEETAECKSQALLAHAEMLKAMEEQELLKAGLVTIERRLLAVQKEIEASRASEKLALTALKSIEESELVEQNGENAPKGVTLSPEEYQTLSKNAHDIEEQAEIKVAAAISQIEEARQSELRSLERLEEVNKEKEAKEDEMKNAVENADKAEEAKLAIEQELSKWRDENEQRRRASDVGSGASNFSESPISTTGDRKPLERSATVPVEAMHGMEINSSGTEVLKKKKKKRSLFPRIVMFLARRKIQPPKPVPTLH